MSFLSFLDALTDFGFCDITSRVDITDIFFERREVDDDFYEIEEVTDFLEDAEDDSQYTKSQQNKIRKLRRKLEKLNKEYTYISEGLLKEMVKKSGL